MQYRGLGGELMSQHMADLYAKQFDVWEQVSRRSSLSALALAATTPRYVINPMRFDNPIIIAQTDWIDHLPLTKQTRLGEGQHQYRCQ